MQPTIPLVYNVVVFGAKPNSNKLSTKAFEKAIHSCALSGGGTVYVPAGEFLTGPIRLQSNITLYLESGARVIFSRDCQDYPVIESRWEGEQCLVFSPQIYGADLENVTITGRGLLDGGGETWWRQFRDKELKYPRPCLISFEGCNNVLIEGIRLVNSPSWTVHPVRCENVIINGITIKNPPDSPNTDGINPDSCKNVHISNCHIDVGDDCIAIKSGKENCFPKIPCENIVISNCTMVRGHGGVVIGSEMSGGVRNIAISNCIFEETDRGIRIKTRRGRGGVVEDIQVSNLLMRHVFSPFVIHMFYNCGAGGKEKIVWDKDPNPVTEVTPIIQRIHFSNIIACEVGAAAGFIYGLPEMPIKDISFNNITVEMTANSEPFLPAMMDQLEPMQQRGFYCCNAQNVAFRNLIINGFKGPAFEIIQSENIQY